MSAATFHTTDTWCPGNSLRKKKRCSRALVTCRRVCDRVYERGVRSRLTIRSALSSFVSAESVTCELDRRGVGRVLAITINLFAAEFLRSKQSIFNWPEVKNIKCNRSLFLSLSLLTKKKKPRKKKKIHCKGIPAKFVTIR